MCHQPRILQQYGHADIRAVSSRTPLHDGFKELRPPWTRFWFMIYPVPYHIAWLTGETLVHSDHCVAKIDSLLQ